VGEIKKIVIDTNVFISGFGWKGKPEEILKLVENRQIINFITPDIFEEVRRVISYPKLKFSESLQIKILEFVLFYSEFIESRKRITFIDEDPDDNKLLECAIEAKAEYIISGDPHLLRLNKFKDIKIIGADEFLNIFSKRGS
jgi:putative PIN family toxin of toxin-antitoxin system